MRRTRVGTCSTHAAPQAFGSLNACETTDGKERAWCWGDSEEGGPCAGTGGRAGKGGEEEQAWESLKQRGPAPRGDWARPVPMGLGPTTAVGRGSPERP